MLGGKVIQVNLTNISEVFYLPFISKVSLAIKYAARSRRMNLANRLDDLARKKAELEPEEESDDDYQQSDWSGRQSKVVPKGHSHPPRTESRRVEQDEEEMEENGMYDEMEEDEPQISSKQGMND